MCYVNGADLVSVLTYSVYIAYGGSLTVYSGDGAM